MDTPDQINRGALQRIARAAMIERGFAPDFSPRALAELKAINGPAAQSEPAVRDLTTLLWCSIDNDDSRDLDQLTVAETMPQEASKVLIAIADVDSTVKKSTALDDHARQNTTSVYTAAAIFPMLPEKLSTDLTSLGYRENRLAIVIEIIFSNDGMLQKSSLYQATVRNQAKLDYTSVAAWLDGTGLVPDAIAAVKGMAETIQLQDQLAQKLKIRRHNKGALVLETLQARPVFDGSRLVDLVVEKSNRAKAIIEDFMIAANTVVAQYLASKHYSSLRRVVRTPKNWGRIVELAAERGATLPQAPDAAALERFLVAAQAADPLRFPDLSLCVIKLLGPGEYVVERPGGSVTGHFGLAVDDYTHSTAPNRRYPDLVVQRILKAALMGQASPYKDPELDALASQCTEKGDAAKKVERRIEKSAAAALLAPRIGQSFDAIVTGASEKGTWVRLLDLPVEGRLVSGFGGKEVGQRLRVEVLRTDVAQGFIDFKISVAAN